MNNIPEGFHVPTGYGAVNNGVASTFLSTVGQPFRFFIAEVYNANKSEIAGFEVNDPVEFVEFVNDAKSKPVHRIDRSLFALHPEILPEYSRWKEGKKSNLTDIREWAVISHSEVGSLMIAGFSTVEQIAQASEEKLMSIGMNWKDIFQKAKQHINTKKKELDRHNYASEIIELRQQLEADREKSEADKLELDKLREEMKAFLSAKSEMKPVIKKAKVVKLKPGVQE